MKKPAVVASAALVLARCGEGFEESRGIPSDGMRNLTATSGMGRNYASVEAWQQHLEQMAEDRMRANHAKENSTYVVVRKTWMFINQLKREPSLPACVAVLIG